MCLKLISIFTFIVLVGNTCCLGIPECGVRSANFSSRETRIIGGKRAAVGQYPWVVALFRTEDCSNFEQICGGSIISERWVLTAAHCVCPRNPEAYRILAGTNDIVRRDVPSAKMYRISQIYIHPEYSDAYYKNDIALVHTLTRIDISSGEIYINRICLPSADEVIGKNVVTAGWGKRNETYLPQKLRKLRLQIMDTPCCSNIYNTEGYSYVDESVLCAYRDGVDTCAFDSGGPLMKKNKLGVYTLVGVVSIGAPNCTIFPALYTKVPYFVSWITEIMEQNEDKRSEFNKPLYLCYNMDRLNCLPRSFA